MGHWHPLQNGVRAAKKKATSLEVCSSDNGVQMLVFEIVFQAKLRLDYQNMPILIRSVDRRGQD
jgi:hypothetical protein